MNFGTGDPEKTFMYLNEAKMLHARSKETDYIMPIILPYIPTILSIIGVVLFFLIIFRSFGVSLVHMGSTNFSYPHLVFFRAIVVLTVIAIVGIAINVYVLYLWITRRNEHIKRSNRLMDTIANICEELGLPFSERIRSYVNRKIGIKEERSVVLNIIGAVLVPFYIFYVYHFLNKDFAEHSKIEYLVISDVVRSLESVGVKIFWSPDEMYLVPERSTLLYIILTIFLGGLFTLFWVYTITDDPNRHFKSHLEAEREVIEALDKYISSSQLQKEK